MIALNNPLTAVLMVGTAVGVRSFWKAVLLHASQNFQHRWEPAIVRGYEQRIQWALDHRALTIGGSLAALVLTVVAFGFLNSGIEYFPENVPPKQVFVDVELPVGSRVEATDAIARRMEEELKTVQGREDWKSEVATIGSGGSGGRFRYDGPGWS